VLKIQRISMELGADPEFFIEGEQGVDGSEKIIPKEGLKLIENRQAEIKNGVNPRDSKKTYIKQDGVQCELNLAPQYCRAYLANEIANCFYTLRKNLQGYKLNNEEVIQMDKKTLDELSKAARKFGCAPSQNAYSGELNKIKVKADKYMLRSAGGHIHFGKVDSIYTGIASIYKDHRTIVQVLDIMLGCVCVLIDRDPWAKKRREVYGRAGDYRLPKHGLEYRTLSNFWLKHYFLMSLVFGLARQAIEAYIDMPTRKKVLEISEYYDIPEIINNNDMPIAICLWKDLKKHIFKRFAVYDGCPINENTVDAFEFVFTKGLDYFFNFDPLNHWAELREAHYSGAYSWLIEIDALREKAYKRW
jgi:hypothetical protein